MVRLTRIYTGGGDQGQTSLGDGARVAKHDLRVEAYGTVDEANAVIGLARVDLKDRKLDAMLSRIQNDLFDLGADLCTPEGPEGQEDNKRKSGALRVTEAQWQRLEREIDEINEALDPLKSFVLPGGSMAAAYLHLARTVARRAERLVSQLQQVEVVNEAVLIYLNRVSDLLFVLARHCNDQGKSDVLWVPGATQKN
jgi:cob(I)alamin adenosyltransferase